MAAAGGHWNKGKFTPAAKRQKATPAQVRIFSGTAQRATVDPYKAKQTGYQESFIPRPAHDKNPFDGQPKATGNTPEYRQAEIDLKNVKSAYKGDLSHEELMQDSQYKNAYERREAEQEISQAARRRGYEPAKMTKAQWSTLADELTTQAKDELRHADQSDRDAVGNKMRGKADTWSQVGGQAMLVRSGASRKQAATAVRGVNQSTKQAADDYMTIKLTDYGYSSHVAGKLTHDQKRRLLAEIGHGEVQKTKMVDLTYEQRHAVVSRVSERRRTEARTMALNPRAGRGLETWGHAMMAAEKADRWDIDLPPAYIFDNAQSKAPKYTQQSKPHPKYQRQEFIEF